MLGLLALLALAGRIYRQVDRMRSAQLRVEGLAYLLAQLEAMHPSTFGNAVRDLLTPGRLPRTLPARRHPHRRPVRPDGGTPAARRLPDEPVVPAIPCPLTPSTAKSPSTGPRTAAPARCGPGAKVFQAFMMHDFGCRSTAGRERPACNWTPRTTGASGSSTVSRREMKPICGDGRGGIPCKTAAVTIHRAVRTGGERYFFSPRPATPPQEHRMRCSCRCAALGADQASWHGARREAGPQRKAAGVRRVG